MGGTGVVAVCSVAAILSLRHGRKGGGDKPCQDMPPGAAWHHLAEDFPRRVAEWRSDNMTAEGGAERRQDHLFLG